jgi:hypothetical protein
LRCFHLFINWILLKSHQNSFHEIDDIFMFLNFLLPFLHSSIYKWTIPFSISMKSKSLSSILNNTIAHEIKLLKLKYWDLSISNTSLSIINHDMSDQHHMFYQDSIALFNKCKRYLNWWMSWEDMLNALSSTSVFLLKQICLSGMNFIFLIIRIIPANVLFQTFVCPMCFKVDFLMMNDDMRSQLILFTSIHFAI